MIDNDYLYVVTGGTHQFGVTRERRVLLEHAFGESGASRGHRDVPAGPEHRHRRRPGRGLDGPGNAGTITVSLECDAGKLHRVLRVRGPAEPFRSWALAATAHAPALHARTQGAARRESPTRTRSPRRWCGRRSAGVMRWSAPARVHGDERFRRTAVALQVSRAIGAGRAHLSRRQQMHRHSCFPISCACPARRHFHVVVCGGRQYCSRRAKSDAATEEPDRR